MARARHDRPRPAGDGGGSQSTTRASIGLGGGDALGPSFLERAAPSADGRYAAFESCSKWRSTRTSRSSSFIASSGSSLRASRIAAPRWRR